MQHTTAEATATIAYSLDSFAKACGLGRTTVFDAVRVGELKTITPVVNGKPLRRKLVTPEAGQKWLSTFPESGAA